MDEYIVDVTYRNFQDNRIQNFKWPDLISVYFCKELYDIFDKSRRFLLKLTKPNPLNLYTYLFAEDSNRENVRIENFYSHYDFNFRFGTLPISKIRTKFMMISHNECRDIYIHGDVYANFATNISYQKNNAEYFETLAESVPADRRSTVTLSEPVTVNTSVFPERMCSVTVSTGLRPFETLTIERKRLERFLTQSSI